MDTLTAADIVTFITSVTALAVACGLIFAVLVQPGRSLTGMLFVGFCVVLAIWALSNALFILPESLHTLPPNTTFAVRSSSLGLIVFAYFFFVLSYLNPGGRVVRIFTLAIFPVTLIALGVNLAGLTYDQDSVFTLTPLGYAVLAGIIGYLVFIFYTILSSAKPEAVHLRVPTVLLIAAFAVNAIPALYDLPVDILLVTTASVWVGWVVMRYQLLNPLNELNDELRIANRDLQQVIKDLADEKSRAEALNVELAAANQHKNEFLANMSHELLTPLNSVIGYSDLLQNGLYGDLTEKQQDRIEKISRNGRQLLGIIQDILDLNKIDSGKLQLDTGYFEIKPIVDNLTDTYLQACQKKGLNFETHIADDLPKLFGDEKRIEQILKNIIDNGVKFTQEGAVVVTARRIDVVKGVSKEFTLPTIGWLKDGAWILVDVKDTGIGIAPEDQGRIFEEFSQIDAGRTKQYGGTGLGLTIAKKLVSMHDGAIWVKSRLAEGSTFFVALPTVTNEMNQPQIQP